MDESKIKRKIGRSTRPDARKFETNVKVLNVKRKENDGWEKYMEYRGDLFNEYSLAKKTPHFRTNVDHVHSCKKKLR